MEGISRALARIDTIRQQVGMPAPGSFQATLDTRLAVTTINPTMQAERPAVVRFDTVPASAGQGIMSDSELDEYLRSHGIEERNGRLGLDELQSIGGGWDGRSMSLLAPAADAWEAMRAAAAADGIDLQIVDGYRSWEVQAAAYEEYLAGRKPANVAPPGTSEHGNGLAVDVTNGSIIDASDAEWRWLQDNARRFGWNPISNETWHWEFRGV
jgi:D-alanyl-D-alanine carboxypeptidase